MTRFNTLSIKGILHNYSFPHKFYVKYAVACAKVAISKIDKPDKRALHAIDLAERFSLGEDINKEELRAAADAAYYADAAAYAAAYAAADAAADAAANAAANAYSAAYYAANAAPNYDFKKLLIGMINKEFCEAEKILIFGGVVI